MAARSRRHWFRWRFAPAASQFKCRTTLKADAPAVPSATPECDRTLADTGASSSGRSASIAKRPAVRVHLLTGLGCSRALSWGALLKATGGNLHGVSNTTATFGDSRLRDVAIPIGRNAVAADGNGHRGGDGRQWRNSRRTAPGAAGLL